MADKIVPSVNNISIFNPNIVLDDVLEELSNVIIKLLWNLYCLFLIVDMCYELDRNLWRLVQEMSLS